MTIIEKISEIIKKSEIFKNFRKAKAANFNLLILGSIIFSFVLIFTITLATRQKLTKKMPQIKSCFKNNEFSKLKNYLYFKNK